MNELITAIAEKHRETGIKIHAGATENQIRNFEKAVGFMLPADFRQFYSICNGIECTEDIFNITSLEDIIEYKDNHGPNWFHFAEYLIYSDTWAVEDSQGDDYRIINQGESVVLGHSLVEFLERLLKGGVFQQDGCMTGRKK